LQRAYFSSHQKLLHTKPNDSPFVLKCASEPRCLAAEDIQIRRFVGELGFIEITDWEYFGQKRNPLDTSMPSRTIEKKGVAARLFEGKLVTGERVLLKEHFEQAKQLGMNELSILKRVNGVWENRRKNDPTLLLNELPVTNLLGFLLADESFQDRSFIEGWVSKFASTAVPQPGNLWLVYQWEATSTCAGFPNVKQEGEVWDLVSAEFKFRRKWNFVLAIMKSALESLSFLHNAGIIHRSLGASSLRLSTTDDRRAKELKVKISDFGFSQYLLEIDDETLRRAQKYGATSSADIVNFFTGEDLYNLGYVFLELIFSSIRINTDPEFPPPISDQTSFKRLIEDIYDFDIQDGLRTFCESEEAWAPAVAFLDADEKLGWKFIEYMVGFYKRLKELGAGAKGTYISADALLASDMFDMYS